MEKTDKQKRSKKGLQAFGISALMIFGISGSTTVNFERRPFTIDDHFFEDVLANAFIVLLISILPYLFLNKKYSYAEIYAGSTIIFWFIVQLLLMYN